VTQVVEALLAQHALHLLRQCQGIIRLADKYGPDRLNAACQLALAYGDPAYQTVRNILLNAREGQDPLPWSDGGMGQAHLAGAYLHGPEQLFALDAPRPNQEDNHG